MSLSVYLYFKLIRLTLILRYLLDYNRDIHRSTYISCFKIGNEMVAVKIHNSVVHERVLLLASNGLCMQMQYIFLLHLNIK